QDSTWPLPWLFWNHALTGDPTWVAIVHSVWWQLRPCLFSWPFMTLTAGHGALLLWSAGLGWVCGGLRFLPLALVAIGHAVGARDWEVAVLGTALLAFVPGNRQQRDRLAFALLGSFTLLCVVHYVVRRHAPPYYFAPLGVCAAHALARLMGASPCL